ncbi:ankyrin repeat and KH domain-containing protein mask-like [Haliotis asinina]|uniref:ankyrin repeat and KH domain-containing protein mask-like n=1 Tax=Haliotis asinina TaxID=109174 RepID=UPI003531B922
MAGSLFFPCCLWTAKDEDGEVYTKTEPLIGAEGITGALREDAEHLRSGEKQDSVVQSDGEETGIVGDTNTTQTFHQHGERGGTLSGDEQLESKPTKETDNNDHEDTLNRKGSKDYKRTKEQDEYAESKDPSGPTMKGKSQGGWTTQECDQKEDPSREGELRDDGPTGDCDKIDPPFEGEQRGETHGSDQLCSVDHTVTTKDELTQGIDQPGGSDDLLIHEELQVSGTPAVYDQHDDTGSKKGSIGSSGSERHSGGEVTAIETGPLEATDTLLENENTLKETQIKPDPDETTLQEHEITLHENETKRQENDTTLEEDGTTRHDHEITLKNQTTVQEQTKRDTDTTQELCQQDESEDLSEVEDSHETDITPDLVQDSGNRDLPSDHETPVTIPGQEFEQQVFDDTMTVQGPPDSEIARDFEGRGDVEDASGNKEQQDADAAQEYVEQVLSELEHAVDDIDVDVDVDVNETLQFPDQETQQPSPNEHPDTALHDACRLGDLQQVKDILSEGQLDINCRGRGGQTPVMAAVRKEHKQVFHFLVDEGADLSLNADDGNNVLHYACRRGQVEMVNIILATNVVDINTKGQGGRTALLWAAGWGRAAVFEILTQKGADLTAVKDGGNNILHVACHGGDMVIVKYILTQDVVDISARNNDGETAAMIASRRGHYPIRKLLTSRGCPMK